MLARSLASLAAAVALGAVTADVASAATIKASVSVQGAGSIGTPFVSKADPGRSCAQKDPVSDSTIFACKDSPWIKSGLGPVSLSITAAEAPGWTFAGWTGCPVPAGKVCTITAVSADATPAVKARFEDHAMPVAVPGLTVVPSGTARPPYTVKWGESEQGLRWQCGIDGGRLEDCRPGFGLDLPEGEHRVSVGAIDPSGNAGPLANTFYTVIDTRLLAGPAEGATVAAVPRFVAGSQAARYFDCAIDRARYTTCGTSVSGELTLPQLRDGSHTLSVRGRDGQWVDETPVSRTFTLDTTAPETTARKVGDRVDFGADEPSTFRCSLDGELPFACASPYFLPDLAAGPHSFEVYALDRVGNRDLTPARENWIVAVPTPVATPTPVPTAPPAPKADPIPAPAGAPVASAPAPTIVAPAAAKQTEAFKVAYTYRKGRLTKLAVTGIPAGQKLVTTIKCPKRAKRCPKSPTTPRKLVGKRLAHGTKITFVAGANKRTIRL